MKIETIALLLKYKLAIEKKMKRLVLNIALLISLGMMITSCSKEEVKPFNSTDPSNVFGPLRSEDGETGQGNSTTSTSTGGETTVTEDEDGITDGGGSSDYDTTKKKKKTN
jgi:hypothetical protein